MHAGFYPVGGGGGGGGGEASPPKDSVNHFPQCTDFLSRGQDCINLVYATTKIQKYIFI